MDLFKLFLLSSCFVFLGRLFKNLRSGDGVVVCFKDVKHINMPNVCFVSEVISISVSEIKRKLSKRINGSREKFYDNGCNSSSY